MQTSIIFRVFNGHTRGMVVLELFLKPGVYSKYDLDPELAKQEKQEFLEELDNSSRLIFFHDPLKESLFYP